MHFSGEHQRKAVVLCEAAGTAAARGITSDLWRRSLKRSSTPHKVASNRFSATSGRPTKTSLNSHDGDRRLRGCFLSTHPDCPRAQDNSIDVICNIETCQGAEPNQLLPIIDPICNRTMEQQIPKQNHGLLARRLVWPSTQYPANILMCLCCFMGEHSYCISLSS